MFRTSNETASDLIGGEELSLEEFFAGIQVELLRVKRNRDCLSKDCDRLWEDFENEKEEIVRLIRKSHPLPEKVVDKNDPLKEIPRVLLKGELMHAEHKLDGCISGICAMLDWIGENRADLTDECEKHRQSFDEKSSEVRQLIRRAYKS